MKFQVQADALLEAVADALKGVSTRRSVEILGAVLVEAGAGVVTVSGTDKEVTVSARCKAKVESTGSCVVPKPKALQAALKEMGSDQALVELDGETVRVERGTLKVRFPLAARDEYPKLAKTGEPALLDAKRLLDQVRAVLPAASTDDLRPVLTGVKLEGKDGALTVAATDSYRLHVRTERDILPAGVDLDVIVPGRVLSLVEKLGRKQPQLGVSVKDMHVGFHVNGRVTVTARRIDAQFPNWRQLRPDAFAALPRVSRADMSAAVTVVDRLACERNAPVWLAFDGDSVLVHGSSYEGVSAEQPVRLAETWALEPLTIGVNGSFFAACLEMFPDAEIVEIGLLTPLRPAIVREPGLDDAWALIMPIRLAA